MEEIENFQGYCLYKTNINYSLSQEEKNYISNLEYGSDDNKNFLSKDRYILKNPLFSNLSKILDKYADHYIKNLLEVDHKLKSLNSWATINKHGGAHHSHQHANTFISVCFYPQIKDGGIIFEAYEDPIRSRTNLRLNIINDNTFNSRTFSFKLSSQDLVIFPGWLHHQGQPNNSNQDRVMIGCNYSISGDIGSLENVDNLYLG